MPKVRQIIGDLLFGVQVLGAIAFGFFQSLRLLESVEGFSVTQAMLVELFAVLHVALAIGAWRAYASRAAKQTIVIYATWIAVMGSIIAAALANGGYVWGSHDIATALLAVAGSVVIYAVVKRKEILLSDPIGKGLLAILFKSAPQVLVAFKILSEGSGGLHGAALLIGHVTILTRLCQLQLLAREAGWDRNRTWSRTSELINEISWIVVTIAWFVMQ